MYDGYPSHPSSPRTFGWISPTMFARRFQATHAHPSVQSGSYRSPSKRPPMSSSQHWSSTCRATGQNRSNDALGSCAADPYCWCESDSLIDGTVVQGGNTAKPEENLILNMDFSLPFAAATMLRSSKR